MISILQSALAEPPPAGWSAAGENILRHAESKPDTFFPLLGIAIPCVLLFAAGLIVVRYVVPAYKEQKQLDREHAKERDTLFREHAERLLLARGKDAAEDAAALRELHRERNEALVQRVEGRIERVTGEIAKIGDRLERHGETLSKVAAKVGTGLACIAIVGLLTALAVYESQAFWVQGSP